ncbi:hypothetical protein ANN_14042 [Periplaneta americana]|uniref:DDE-1 domain-containing protein n=1 Tax=Periplaneta americana TaxID=6978 RepID=A0ABQ8SV71_PERAM|nr:hypothetical protein ANN_14042 [Periplaneta americana]
MSPGSNTESYPAFAHIGLRENPEKPQPVNLPRPGIESRPPGFVARRANRYSSGAWRALKIVNEEGARICPLCGRGETSHHILSECEATTTIITIITSSTTNNIHTPIPTTTTFIIIIVIIVIIIIIASLQPIKSPGCPKKSSPLLSAFCSTSPVTDSNTFSILFYVILPSSSRSSSSPRPPGLYKKTLLAGPLRRKRRRLVETIPMILLDNVRSHTANAVTDLLRCWRWEVLDLPSYSPDMSPCDYDLYPKMEEPLRGKYYNTRDAIIHAIERPLRKSRDGRADDVRRFSQVW